MNEIITIIIRAVLGLLAVLITGQLIPWLKERTTAEQRSKFAAVVITLVRAAEQIFKTLSGKPDSGKTKKQWVLEQVQTLGLTVSEAELDALIESAVLGLRLSENV
jgi:type II secretory pathway pseudopilin PulG